MHVFFVSNCKKKSLKKTRAILDSYALRTGPRSWKTPITSEALDEIWRLLRRVATKNTAVACYRNEGFRDARLLWTVGAHAQFGEDGHFASGCMAHYRGPNPVPKWVRHSALLANAGGLSHDHGKAVEFFQTRLASADDFKSEIDPVRHEWISMLIAREMAEGKPIDEAWSTVKAQDIQTNRTRPAWFKPKNPIRDWRHALEYIVATHHKAIGSKGGNCDSSNHVRFDAKNARKLKGSDWENRSALLDASTPKTLSRQMRRLEKASNEPQMENIEDAHYWRAITLYSRACLILADHLISSEDYRHSDDDGSSDLLAKSSATQSLDWHLNAVAKKASDFAYRLYRDPPGAVSAETIEYIVQPSTAERFRWQDRAYSHILKRQNEKTLPCLIFNLAGTGSGKTRMNAKAVIAANKGENVRFSTALNLRSLTLQTGDSYREDLGMKHGELSCVIGDTMISKLHALKEKDKVARPQGDTQDSQVVPERMEGQDPFGFEVSAPYHMAPPWLEDINRVSPGSKAILSSPVLVSTIDTIIQAGEPYRQGKHAIQMLRLMHGDLVLDELDSYDPDSFMAVARIIMIAGMFGRNVVISSATLPQPVAEAIFRAYEAGMKLYAALEGRRSMSFRYVHIDDFAEPSSHVFHSAAKPENTEDFSFSNRFSNRVKCAAQVMHKNPHRLASIKNVDGDIYWAAAEGAASLHDNHSWEFSETEKRVSFGLVRCANIKVAIPMARYLAESMSQHIDADVKVACYHSNDLVIQRFHKEKRLDYLLRRHDGNSRIENDEEVGRIVRASQKKHVIFVVVATPVEEIGRDHDFDWAVIEPTSLHSIIQTSGRVNRHRLVKITEPNIVVLRFNQKKLDGRNLVFHRPGLESEANCYSSHDVLELMGVDWFFVHSGIRYERNLFAQEEDRLWSSRLSEKSSPLERFLAHERSNWIQEDIYRNACLRSHSGETIKIFLDREEFHLSGQVLEVIRSHSHQEQGLRRVVEVTDRKNNDWLVLNIDDLCRLSRNLQLNETKAMSVDIPRYGDQYKLSWDQSFGWQIH